MTKYIVGIAIGYPALLVGGPLAALAVAIAVGVYYGFREVADDRVKDAARNQGPYAMLAEHGYDEFGEALHRPGRRGR